MTSAIQEVLVKDQEVMVFPNPARDYVVFQTQREAGAVFNISVSDPMGNAVWKYRGENSEKQVTLDSSTLPKGIYFYYLENGPAVQTGKIILQ